MIQIKKVFCLLELKWGMLLIGIVELILCSILGGVCRGMHVDVVYYLSLIVSILHIVACVLLIVSIFEPKKGLVILYLITGIIRLIVLIVGIIWLICYGLGNKVHNYQPIHTESIIVMIISLVLTVYFWLCVYSWFKKLGGSTPVD
ncbi:uncharacterized protein LOC117189359 [Drosophila miranda]|uniref:uncharacterized protein LOC117189358 n=1 Tax=Drosophila miranda TaxID=7229 RepID=UPI00143F2A2C|nr:uncharacterized protein LOC117189358 [Drosophila miranda]XP_033250383.1 uncharacterized protein LOC117189359 [Drosophila miranda]